MPVPPQTSGPLRPRTRRRSPSGRHCAPSTRPNRTVALLAGGSAAATATVFALIVAFAVTPHGSSDAASAKLAADTQSFKVSPDVQVQEISRDSYTMTDGVKQLVEGGTNYDWAKLVLLYADFPITDANVAVMTRWMRQENGPNDWWNRNNPLNNGNGSGGGAGLGSYANLTSAAKYCADSLLHYSGYSKIRAALASSAPTSVTESAIWNSPWASSHYAYGDHWAYTPVEQVKAPASDW